MNIFLQISIIIFTTLIGSTTMAQTIYKKPYYGIKLNLVDVGVDIRLNDIPIYFDEEKGQLSVDLPAPSSIINGDNELKIIAFLPYIDDENKMEKFSAGSEVNISLYIQEYDDPENKKEILSKISIKFNEKNEAILIDTDKNPVKATFKLNNNEKVIATRHISINSNFPKWQWESGQKILDNEENYNSLLKAYKEIYTSFKNNDTDKIFKLYANRAKEVTTAYYLSDISEGHNKISTGKDVSDSSLELYDFWTEGMKLDVYADGKMARIINKDTTQPIIFVDREAGAIHTHKFGFYKNKENKWVMIR